MRKTGRFTKAVLCVLLSAGLVCSDMPLSVPAPQERTEEWTESPEAFREPTEPEDESEDFIKPSTEPMETVQPQEPTNTTQTEELQEPEKPTETEIPQEPEKPTETEISTQTEELQEPTDTQITEEIPETDETETETEPASHEEAENKLTFSNTDIANGTSADIRWSIDRDGKLTIEGTGDYERDDKAYAPWYGNAKSIQSAVVAVKGMTNAHSMFYGCFNMKSVDLSGFDTAGVTDMGDMFWDCGSLTELELSGFDTGNVTDMSGMFRNCSTLEKVDVSGFQTGSVTNMSNMFSTCNDLTSVDVSGFDTGNVTNMSSMFANSGKLKSIDVSGFDTENVTDMGGMFGACGNLESIDVSGFDTGNVTKMMSMFGGCSKLKSVDVSGFDTGNVTDMSQMFYYCSNLTEVDVSGFDTGNVTKMIDLFKNCSSLTEVDVSGFDTKNVTTMQGMFEGCSSLTKVDVSGFDTKNVGSMWDMFGGCSNLTEVDVSGFDTRNVTHTASMFRDCSSLTKVDVSGFDTRNVTNMSGMFFGCSSLTSVDVSGFDTGNVAFIHSMFAGCSKLAEVDVSGFDTGNVTHIATMFSGCSSLTSVDVSGFDTGNVEYMWNMFEDCSSLEQVDVSGFDTRNVTMMGSMFSGCSGLKKLDLSSVDMGKATSVDGLLSNTPALMAIYVPRNLTMDSFFDEGVTYKDLQGTTYESLPKNREQSLLLYRGDLGEDAPKAHITAKKTKTVYACGETLDTGDIKAVYYGADGTAKTLRQTDYTTNAAEIDMTSVGKKTLTISYTPSDAEEGAQPFTADIALTVGRLLDDTTVTITFPAADAFDYVYDGSPKKPTPAVQYTDGGETVTLTPQTDYTVSYRYNTNAYEKIDSRQAQEDAPTAVITGCGAYLGTVEKTFAIQKAPAPELTELVRTVNAAMPSDIFKLSADIAQYGKITGYRAGAAVEDDTVSGNVLAGEPSIKADGKMSVMINQTVASGDFVTIPVTISFRNYADAVRKVKIVMEGEPPSEKKTVNISGIEMYDFIYNKMPVSYSGTASVVSETDNTDLTGTVKVDYTYSGTQADGSAYAASQNAPVNAGSYTLTVAVASDNTEYTGSRDYPFCIAKASLTITARDMVLQTGAPLPKQEDFSYDITGLLEGDTLTKAPAADCGITDTTAAGSYDITVSGADAGMNYEIVYQNGTLTVQKTGESDDNDDSPYDDSERIPLESTDLKAEISDIKAKIYDAQNPYKPSIKVTAFVDGKKTVLTEGADYRVSYENNSVAGEAKVIVKGNGIYKGQITKSFTITPKFVKKLKILAGDIATGSAEPDLSTLPIHVYDGTRHLTLGTDYTLSSYSMKSKKYPAAAEVTVTGIGNYADKAVAKFKIYESGTQLITAENVTLASDTAPYTGKAVKPEVTVAVNGKTLTSKHYKVSYQNNKNAGTAYAILKGKGEYAGTVVVPFTIKAETGALAIKDIKAAVYNGKLQKPSVSVSIQKSGKPKKLSKKDYDVTYKNNLHAGTARVIVTGKGNYAGLRAEGTFTINSQQLKKAVIKGTKGKLTLLYNKRKLKEGTDYRMPQYGKTEKNKVEVTIVGIGDFTGEVTKKVKVSGN